MDIHSYEKRYQTALRTLNKDKRISDRNKELILDFINDMVLENVSKPRLLKYVGTMSLIVTLHH